MLQRILLTLVHGVLPVVLGILLASLGVLFVYLAIHFGTPILAGIDIRLLGAMLWKMLEESLAYQELCSRYGLLLHRLSRVWRGVLVLFGVVLFLMIGTGCVLMLQAGEREQPFFFFVVLLGSVSVIVFTTRHHRWFARKLKAFGGTDDFMDMHSKGVRKAFDMKLGLELVYDTCSKQFCIHCNCFSFEPFSEDEIFLPLMDKTESRLRDLSPKIEFHYVVLESWYGRYSLMIPRKVATSDLLKRIRPILEDVATWEDDLFCIHLQNNGIHYYGKVEYNISQAIVVFEDGSSELYDDSLLDEDGEGMSDEMLWFLAHWADNLDRE